MSTLSSVQTSHGNAKKQASASHVTGAPETGQRIPPVLVRSVSQTDRTSDGESATRNEARDAAAAASRASFRLPRSSLRSRTPQSITVSSYAALPTLRRALAAVAERGGAVDSVTRGERVARSLRGRR